MARLKTGEYHGVFFDAYGERIKQAKQVFAPCYTQALKKCRRYAKICQYNSYRIDRAIYNSLDGSNKW